MDNYDRFQGYQQPGYYMPRQSPYPNGATYPGGWQSYQSYQTPVNNPQFYQNNNNIQQFPQMIWTTGIEGAKGYVLPNGATVPLWDSESQTIYIKSVDSNGKPSLTILDYTERNAAEQPAKEEPVYATKEQVDNLSSQYATRDQFDSLMKQLGELTAQMEDIQNRIMSFGKPQQYNNRKGVNGNNG